MAVGSLRVYASVKSYSLKGKLLTKKNYQTLAESRDLDEFIVRIKNTSYGNSVSTIQKPYKSIDVESALRSRQADLHFQMLSSIGNSEILMAYFMKFIIWNLKIILKGKVLEKPQEEIQKYVNLHAEELIKRRDVVLKALLAKDLDEAVANLKTIKYGDQIEKAVNLYRERKLIPIFDIYFDKILYQNLAHVIKGTSDLDLLSLFGMDLDFYNILGILRGKFWGLTDEQIQDLLVPHTSSTSKELLARMIATESVRSALNELSSTKYKSLIPNESSDIESIGNFERAFTQFIYESLSSGFSKMFRYSTIVAITRLYDYEVKNLAAISYAVEQKIPTETTMSKLILSAE